jgi:hypothetical protein
MAVLSEFGDASRGVARFKSSNFDFIVFVSLFALTLLFELQLLIPQLSTFHVRHVLIIYVFCRLFVTAGSWKNVASGPMPLFLVLCGAIGIETAARFGPDLAIAGLLRFVNVAVLALFAARFVTTTARLRFLLMLWLIAILGGAATALYQLGGGEMPWLVGNYYSDRADLIRYKTILGDPNVGGMSAAITLTGALVLAWPFWVRLVIIALSLTLVVLSLSKAAVILALLGLLLSILLEKERLLRRFASGPARPVIVAAVILGVIAIASQVPAFRAYETMTVEALAHVIDDRDDQSAVNALKDRALFRVDHGVALLSAMPPSAILNFLFGGSYGIAGSVAVDARGEPAAFLPHNGYLELFLVGGLTLLGAFIHLVARAGRALYALRRSDLPEVRFLIVALPMLLSVMVGYPIMYEPILGSIFWLIIGVALGEESATAARHPPITGSAGR